MPVREPQIGDIGLYHITGPIGVGVDLGQLFAGDSSHWTHAFMVVQDRQVLEAEVSGAVLTPLDYYLERQVVWSTGKIALTDAQRVTANEVALTLVGTPYSFLDYFALSAHRLHVPSTRLDKYVASSKHMICSQMVDYIWSQVGVHMFTDDRLPQNVTPGNIANAWLLENWLL